jgi:hypothetical protein
MHEQALVQHYDDLINENITIDMLRSNMLYCATMDPESVLPYLFHDDREGLIPFLRDQSVPVARPEVFCMLQKHLQKKPPAISSELYRSKIFWTFVNLMLVEEGVHNLVRSTWQGSQRMWDIAVMPYFHNRRDDWFHAPSDPKNAHHAMIQIWLAIRLEFGPFNVRVLLLNGIFRPVHIILSRNALRARRNDLEREAKAKRRKVTFAPVPPPAPQ